MTPNPHTQLAERHRQLLSTGTHLRARDAAARLAVTEAELVASGAVGEVTRLRCEPAAILADLAAVGTVMALTRNETAVIECDGDYGSFVKRGAHALVLDAQGIDLRLFLSRWAFAFALVMQRGDRTLRALQFFDAHGAAVHKIYLRPAGDRDAWQALVDRYATEHSPLRIEPPAPPPVPADDPDVDAFQAGWRALQDTHDFFPLLRKHRLTRVQALQLAPEGMVERLLPTAAEELLTDAASADFPIMTFVSSPGCVQIRTADVQTVRRMGTWINILDPGFNLHLRLDRLAAAWLVRKPTKDGIVSSAEFYDADGELVVQFFGERKEGRAERAEWRDLLDALPRA